MNCLGMSRLLNCDKSQVKFVKVKMFLSQTNDLLNFLYKFVSSLKIIQCDNHITADFICKEKNQCLDICNTIN